MRSWDGEPQYSSGSASPKWVQEHRAHGWITLTDLVRHIRAIGQDAAALYYGAKVVRLDLNYDAGTFSIVVVIPKLDEQWIHKFEDARLYKYQRGVYHRAQLEELARFRKTNPTFLRSITPNEFKKHFGCAFCSAKNNLHLHHVNPYERAKSSLGGVVSWEEFTRELELCIILCQPCHAYVHRKKIVAETMDGKAAREIKEVL